jgi:hypothetical protein
VVAEFILIANEIAATVQVTDVIAVGPRSRMPIRPGSVHGLTALVYGLVETDPAMAALSLWCDQRDGAGQRARMAGTMITYGPAFAALPPRSIPWPSMPW